MSAKNSPLNPKTNWVCTSGEINNSSGVLSYKPTWNKDRSPQEIIYAFTQSNRYFSVGKISYKLKLESELSFSELCLGIGNTPTYIGINQGGYAYSIRTWDFQSNQANTLVESGQKNTIQFGEWIEVEVEVDGSLIILRIFGVEVLRAIVNFGRAQIGLAFWGNSPAEIKDIKIEPVKPKVFVVMQFTNEFNEIYDDVILPVCNDFDLEAIRADDIYNNGLIIQDIINSINESAVIIADITPDNPNVYYEVGYAHASAKPVILLCDSKREKLPFDLSGFRTIFYRNRIAGKSEVETQLRKHLEALLPHSRATK